MRIELIVWGSREWYEEAQPFLEESHLTEVPDTHWADPETDGERMSFSYTYSGDKPLSWDDLVAIITRVQAILAEAEAPLEAIQIRADAIPRPGKHR